MKPPVKLLLIYVDETDLWETGPLYEAIMRRLRQLGVAGATAQLGSMGFGSHQTLHHKHLFGISDDRPVTISVVDNETVIRAALPEIRRMVKDGLIALIDAEAIERPPETEPRE
jgi:PII-like signaling protein